MTPTNKITKLSVTSKNINAAAIAHAVALVGTVVLPKVVKGTNKFTMTAISAAEIAGCEPSKVFYNGKTYDGAKVYTIHGSYFKCLVNPSQLLLAHAKAKESPTALVTMNSSVGELAGYSEHVKSLPKFKG